MLFISSSNTHLAKKQIQPQPAAAALFSLRLRETCYKVTWNYLRYTDVTARVLQVVKNMLLRINNETKLKPEASVKLVITFIVVVHIVVVILLSLLADAVALDSVCNIGHQLSLLVMMLMMMRGGAWSSWLSWLD